MEIDHPTHVWRQISSFMVVTSSDHLKICLGSTKDVVVIVEWPFHWLTVADSKIGYCLKCGTTFQTHVWTQLSENPLEEEHKMCIRKQCLFSFTSHLHSWGGHWSFEQMESGCGKQSWFMLCGEGKLCYYPVGTLSAVSSNDSMPCPPWPHKKVEKGHSR